MMSRVLPVDTLRAHYLVGYLLFFFIVSNASSAFVFRDQCAGQTYSFSRSYKYKNHFRNLPTLALAASSSTEQSQQDSTKISSQKEILHRSQFLGDIYKITIDNDDDFLAANAVPTFAAMENSSRKIKEDSAISEENTKAKGLEGALDQGPAFVLDSVLSSDVCEDIIETCEQLQFGSYKAGKNFHGAMQIIVPSYIVDMVAQTMGRHIDVDQVAALREEMMTNSQQQDDSSTHDVRLVYAGLNRRWRIYRYAPGGEETFAPHIDAGFPPSGLSEDGTGLVWDASTLSTDDDSPEVVSRLTILMYLNDDFEGGQTKFYEPSSSAATSASSSVIASVKPVAGSVLVFPQGVGEEAVDYARQHWPLHEGSPVMSGHRPKYVIRSDVLFKTTREPLPLNQKLFQHDHLVRQTFLPRSAPSIDRNFLSHLSSLYNPHMGVENLGPLLYSLIRFTKKRKIVEIGAGYTSLWILQALKDNDLEFERVQQLLDQDKCRLLDIQWANSATVDESLQTPASLLCIDNCEHQKETATGACAVAKSLGLDSYLEFLEGDAFDMADILEESSVDILWCDFGVGSRMKEFMSSGAWSSVRPGGFLLCHSTLTNQRTRDWLEAARAHKGEEITGIPPDEYVELSLLEPHKHYQNSVSIFQKRRTQVNEYTEPVFSEYA